MATISRPSSPATELIYIDGGSSEAQWDCETTWEDERQRQERGNERKQQEDKVGALMATVAKLTERLEQLKQQCQAQAGREMALAPLEPMLRVILMVPDQRINGMHAEVSVRWSSVYVRDGKAVFKVEGTEYCLERSRLTPHLYLGYLSRSDGSDVDGDVFD